MSGFLSDSLRFLCNRIFLLEFVSDFRYSKVLKFENNALSLVSMSFFKINYIVYSYLVHKCIAKI